ncbi:aldehyde dehydrogenase [Gryllotalpicola reticulitermitis]|uniref:Aldehyde dehydrogenase n=1 Tax=Gryllotalpicola reticulitermitis TaxID=1184153 RepID=A0ABV8QAM5_9MICO
MEMMKSMAQSMAQSMSMDSMPMDMHMDMGAMQECIQAMNSCSMAATMCAATDMSMGAEMATCAAMCSNMANLADAGMRMMMRPMGMNMDVMQTMLMACMTMGKACAAECRMHAEMDEMCRYCAMACDDMVAKCEAVMASMTA